MNKERLRKKGEAVLLYTRNQLNVVRKDIAGNGAYGYLYSKTS